MTGEVVFTDPVERLAARLWIALPRAVMLRRPGLRGVVGDGHVVTMAPPAAALLPVATLLAGLGVGALQLGYEVVFTESIVLLSAAVALAAFSGQLALLALLGFALGEFVVGVRTWSMVAVPAVDGPLADGVVGALVRVRLPLLITYLLLAAIMIVLPRAARNLVVAIGRWRAIPAVLAWPLASGLYVVIVWQATRIWAAAAPILVRPRFTFLGRDPVSEAIQPLQTQWQTLVAWAVAAAILRQLLILVSMARGPLGDRVRRLEQVPPAGGVPVAADLAGRASGSLAADLLSATGATLVLTGLFTGVPIAVATFGVLLVTRMLRSGRLELDGLDAWRATTARVPVALRLAGLWLLAVAATSTVANSTIGSYTAMVVVILVGVLLTLALFPGPPPDQDVTDGEARPGVTPSAGGPGDEVDS